MVHWPELLKIIFAVLALRDSVAAFPNWLTTSVNILAGGVSAVIGGFAGSYLSEHFARKRREIDELAGRKLSAFALHLQLVGIYTDLTQYSESLGQSRVASRALVPFRRFRAQYHQAYAGEQAPAHFRVEDLKALAVFGSNELLNLIADLDRRFNVVVAALNQYRALWLEMSAMMEGEVRGDVIIMHLTPDQERRLAPKMAVLSKALNDLDPLVERLVNDTYQALLGLYHAQVKSLGQTQPFESFAPDGQWVKVMPDPNAQWSSPKERR